MTIIERIQQEIVQDYYKNKFPNDGQRFIAWYLRNIYYLDQLQARDAITDGQNDKQIDAVYIDDDNSKIHIIQGKFYTGDVINAVPVREVISSWTKMKDIKTMQQDANERLTKKLSEVARALEDDYVVSFELVATSHFTEDAQKDIDAFQKMLSEDDSFDAEFEVVDIDLLEDFYQKSMEADNPSINDTIHLEKGKYLITEIAHTKVIMAALPLKECIKIKGIKDGSLFQKNVRQSLGISNVVNKKIKKTILGDKCPEFFFYHNGITAICNKIIEQDNDTIDLKGLSVVNGCQSLNTILSCSETVKKQDEAYVLFRFYEIPQRDRADNISINTNTQSAVKARDLRSNDKRVLRLKKAYEQEYPNGFFATKRGEVTPADKDANNTIDLSYLGKYLIAWYSQRPNLSYGETKIFDVYFNTLFKNEYSPKDVYALNYWMRKIMEVWTEENPLSIDNDLLTMKAYAPYHFLFAVSAIFAKFNKRSDVPSPNECLKVAERNGIVEHIVGIAANCMNQAIETESANALSNGRTFIPQNWVKNKSSISSIQAAITNYVSFMPTMAPDMYKKLSEAMKLDPNTFVYRVAAD